MSAAPAPGPTVDLNADLGEHPDPEARRSDSGLLRLVTSANVACGFHAGDTETMRQLCAQAAQTGVQIGAHFGYRDFAGFGRRELGLAAAEIAQQTGEQVQVLGAIAAQEGVAVNYAKPHGALYQRLGHDDETAAGVLSVLSALSVLAVLGPPGSALLEHAARQGVRPVPEGFCDRGYATAVVLKARTEPAALLAGQAAADQAVSLALGRPPLAADGTPVRTPVRSLCLHGDSPGALLTAGLVRAVLTEAGVTLRAFAGCR